MFWADARIAWAAARMFWADARIDWARAKMFWAGDEMIGLAGRNSPAQHRATFVQQQTIAA